MYRRPYNCVCKAIKDKFGKEGITEINASFNNNIENGKKKELCGIFHIITMWNLGEKCRALMHAFFL